MFTIINTCKIYDVHNRDNFHIACPCFIAAKGFEFHVTKFVTYLIFKYLIFGKCLNEFSVPEVTYYYGFARFLT